MNQEVELKFEIEPSSIELLTHFVKTLNPVEQHTLQLTNTYYDTKERLLRHISSSVRIRSTLELGKTLEHEITVKSAGNSIAGLHARRELNKPLPNNHLDLSVLPVDTFPADIDVNLLEKQLIALFSTDFCRQTWLINFNNSEIEIALDQGTISGFDSSSNVEQPILEIELELKSGNQQDLLLFAVELSQFDLHLFSQSKAARGYCLVDGKVLTKSELSVKKNESAQHMLANILQYWQTNEEYALAHHDLNIYQSTLNSVQRELVFVLKQTKQHDSSLLAEVYLRWSEQIKSMAEIKSFAFSSINTKLKLFLILLLYILEINQDEGF